MLTEFFSYEKDVGSIFVFAGGGGLWHPMAGIFIQKMQLRFMSDGLALITLLKVMELVGS